MLPSVSMIHLLILAVHLLATIAKLVRPGGVRAVVAESLVLKHQLLISSRARRREPNLNSFDRFLLGLGSLFARKFSQWIVDVVRLTKGKPIAPGSPWQNSFAERLIGSIRRECVDHVIALGEQHLRRVLKSYTIYYNSARTHRSLDKDLPVSRPVQRVGRIVSHDLVGGLHRQYVRI